METILENNEYILCSAIKRIKPKECHPYYNNDICDIEIGYRHHDIFQRFRTEVSLEINDQGFYTSSGRFVDRIEAMYIAQDAHQIMSDNFLKFVRDKNGNIIDWQVQKLCSEDLY